MSGPGLCQHVERFAFERTKDLELIKTIVTHPYIWPGVSDDFSPEPEKWQPMDPEVWTYLTVSEAGELLGLWALVPLSTICWEVHTCLLPKAYGSTAIAAAESGVQWVFSRTACKRIVTNVPAYNRLALRFAKACGFTEYGFNPDSYQKEGRLW